MKSYVKVRLDVVHRCEKGWQHQTKEEQQFYKEEMTTLSRKA